MSVQIAIFILHDLDFLCEARTAPCHSWRNSFESHVNPQSWFAVCGADEGEDG